MKTINKFLAFCFLFLFTFYLKADYSKDTMAVSAFLAKAKQEAKANPEKALLQVQAAITLSKKINYKKGLVTAYNSEGRLYRLRGEYDKALLSYQEGLVLCDSIEDWYNMSSLYNNMGTVYLKQGNNQLALDYFQKSLRVSNGKVDPIENAPTENNIGLIYWGLGELNKALEYFNSTLETFKKAGDNVSAAGSYSNIGGIYYYLKDQKKSIGYFKLALQAYQIAGDSGGVGLTCTNIADVCSELKHYKEAELYLKRAYTQLEKRGDVPGMIYALMGMANAANGNQQYKQAEEYLKKAMEYSNKTNSPLNLQTVHFKLAENYSLQNKFKEAYENMIKYAELKDTIHKQDAAKQILELDAKYKDEQKNKKIELLQKQKLIADLSKQEEDRKHQVMLNYLFGAVAIVLLIAFFMYTRYKTKQKANLLLEKKNQDIEQQKQLIENKSAELAEKNKEITDGIRYAKRIQMALVTSDKYIAKHVKEHFVLYKPKDIVSGDFYLALKVNDQFYFTVADCTGHGVPGAFMSMIGINLLNEIIVQRKITNPALVLDIMREEVIKNLNQEDAEEESKDGMDMVLCKLDTTNRTLEFAAANNSIYILNKEKGEIVEYKGDKMPVGKHAGVIDSFTKHSLTLNENDTIYAFTDGYPDQFGGNKGKKFKYKQLEELLLSIHHLPMQEQREKLAQEFVNWKGNLEQVDDVCIIGIRL